MPTGRDRGTVRCHCDSVGSTAATDSILPPPYCCGKLNILYQAMFNDIDAFRHRQLPRATIQGSAHGSMIHVHSRVPCGFTIIILLVNRDFVLVAIVCMYLIL